MKIVVENRRATYDFFIVEEFSAGIVLTGTEVKALRLHKANLTSTFVLPKGGEMFVHGLHIPQYKYASKFNHEPKRVRKLLLHKREINKLVGSVQAKGLTIIVRSIFFSESKKAKLKIALAKGKKNYDRREALKAKDQKRELRRDLD